MTKTPYSEMNDRTRDIFREVVENYILYGNPVGSRTLERSDSIGVSAATIRNVMVDLEEMGLLYAPHKSAGRLPTTQGLRFFIDGILEIDTPTDAQRQDIVRHFQGTDHDQSVEALLNTVSQNLSGLSGCASLIAVPKTDKPLRQIEFIRVDSTQAVVVMVAEDGDVENRMLKLPENTTGDDLARASNYLNERLAGRSLGAMRESILAEIRQRETVLGQLTTHIIEAGIATRTADGTLIISGRSNLLEDRTVEDLDRIREMMDQLEQKEFMSRLIEEAAQADGMKIFIGSENTILRTEEHSMILAPYTSGSGRDMIGTIGVIGPTRLNYAKIIPSINVFAEILSRKIHAIDQPGFAQTSE